MVGGFFIGLFMLGNERFFFFENLNPYTPGFLIISLVALDFGVLFALIPLYASEGRKNNKTKKRIVLILAIIIFLILLGYLLATKAEWTVEAWIIENSDEFYTIFGTFTITNYNAFLASLLSFGILVLPFAIAESGILDNYPNEPPDPDVERR